MIKTMVSVLLAASLCSGTGVAQKFVTANGKETISIIRVGYGQKGEAVRKQLPGLNVSQIIQKLNIHREKQSDSDVLLLFIEFKADSFWISKECALVAADGAKFPIVAQGQVKSSITTGSVDTAGFFSGAEGFYSSPLKRGEAQILAFNLPPTSGRFTVNGFKEFTPAMTIDLK
jgi:hypothetical protein